MNEMSNPSEEPTLPGLDAHTSSPASEVGTTPSDSQDGTTKKTEWSGPVPVRVNPSPSLPRFGKEWQTQGTFGLNSVDSSPSAFLQQSLESRLVARLAGIGSLEYALTWKHWAIASGPPICALRASVRHTSGKGCIGWPTARANDSTGAKRPDGRMGGESLKTVAGLTGYPTPDSQSAGRGSHACDDFRKYRNSGHYRRISINDVATKIAGSTTSTSGRTGRRGALNPALSRWLMGFPAEWDSCGATAMPSSRKSRHNS